MKQLLVIASAAVIVSLMLACGSVYAANPVASPSICSVKTTENSASITWAAAGNVTGYAVSCDGQKILTKGHAATFSDLDAGHTYRVKLRAYKVSKRYFNAKTKKWQGKKPKRGGKTKKIKKYSKVIVLKVQTKEPPAEKGALCLYLESGEDPVQNVPVRLASDRYTYAFTSDMNGEIQSQDIEEGVYDIQFQDTGEYDFPEGQKVEIVPEETACLSIQCEKKPSFFDVAIESDCESKVTVSILKKDGQLVCSSSSRVACGLNYVDDYLPIGEYIVVLETDAGWKDQKEVSITSSGKVYSVVFAIEEQQEA